VLGRGAGFIFLMRAPRTRFPPKLPATRVHTASAGYGSCVGNITERYHFPHEFLRTVADCESNWTGVSVYERHSLHDAGAVAKIVTRRATPPRHVLREVNTRSAIKGADEAVRCSPGGRFYCEV
jgi:hypothetical protein